MTNFKKTTLNYTELLSALSEIQLVFYASMYGNCRLLSYLRDEHNQPTIKHNFKLMNTDSADVQHYKKEYLINAIDSISKFYNRDYNYYIEEKLFPIIKRLSIENLIVNTYELLNNYCQHTDPQILKHLKKLDWYQMLHVLRRNAAHFNNIGKKLGGFPDGFPNPVKWQNFEVSSATMGHDLTYTDTYAINLVKCCREYIKGNELAFSKQTV